MHSSYEFLSDRIQSLFSKYSLPKIFELLDYSADGGKLTRYSMFTHICDGSKNDDINKIDDINNVNNININNVNKNDDISNVSNIKILNSIHFNKKLIGLCLEIFHTSFLISDDIVDNSLVRGNKPCYYFRRKMATLRDSKFLISLIYKLLRDSPCRSVFEKSFFDTCLGQTIDTKKKTRVDYNLTLYRKICELKTSSYSVYLPLACGYKFIKKGIPSYLEDLTNLVGLIYQMNDDYLNFFPGKQNKTGNDLEEYKLTYFTAKMNEVMSEVMNSELMNSELMNSELMNSEVMNSEVMKSELMKSEVMTEKATMKDKATMKEKATIKEVEKDKALEVFYNQEGVPDYISEWIKESFPKYYEDKKALVDESRNMIKEEDERDLLFLYDILKKYELN